MYSAHTEHYNVFFNIGVNWQNPKQQRKLEVDTNIGCTACKLTTPSSM